MTARTPDKGEVQELLVTLYLRLNGYFTSGFIVHAPRKGQSRTEIDVLGVRFPKNAEPEREVAVAGELDPTTWLIDVVIAEVKSEGRDLQFNEALRNSPSSVASVLRWVGLYEEAEIQTLAQKLGVCLAPENASRQEPPTIDGPRDTRIRGLLFSPERPQRQPDDPWFITGEHVFSHIWRCLRPSAPRTACAASYDFGLWGPGLEPIVRFFKAQKGPGPGGVKQLVDFLK